MYEFLQVFMSQELIRLDMGVQVGSIAINDGILLRNHIFLILKTHFRDQPFYVELLDLFNEVGACT